MDHLSFLQRHADAANLAGSYSSLARQTAFFRVESGARDYSYSAIPRIPLGWPTALSSEGTLEEKGPFGSGRPS